MVLRHMKDATEVFLFLPMVLQMVTTLPPCGVTINYNNGVITSPNYPKPYLNNITCEWSIRTTQGTIIDMTFEEFILEGRWDGQCSDFVKILDSDSKVLMHKCNSEAKGALIRSNTNWVRVHFHSDKTNGEKELKGFKMTWKAINDTKSTTAITTIRSRARSSTSTAKPSKSTLKPTNATYKTYKIIWTRPSTTSTATTKTAKAATIPHISLTTPDVSSTTFKLAGEGTLKSTVHERESSIKSTLHPSNKMTIFHEVSTFHTLKGVSTTSGVTLVTSERNVTVGSTRSTQSTISDTATLQTVSLDIEDKEPEKDGNIKLYFLLVLSGLGFMIITIAAIASFRCKAKRIRTKQAQKEDQKQNSDNENHMWTEAKRLSFGPDKALSLNVRYAKNNEKETQFSKRFPTSGNQHTRNNDGESPGRITETESNMMPVRNGHKTSKEKITTNKPDNHNYELVKHDDYEKSTVSTKPREKKDVHSLERMLDTKLVSSVNASTKNETDSPEVAKSYNAEITLEQKSHEIAQAVMSKINLKSCNYDMAKACIPDVSTSIQKTRKIPKTPVDNYENAKAPINSYEFAKARVDNFPVAKAKMNTNEVAKLPINNYEVAKAHVTDADIAKSLALNFEMITSTKQTSKAAETSDTRETDGNLYYVLKKNPSDTTGESESDQTKEFQISPINNGNYYKLSELPVDDRKQKGKLGIIPDNKKAGKDVKAMKDCRTYTSDDNEYYTLSDQTQQDSKYELAQKAQTKATENDNYFVLTKTREFAKKPQTRKEVSDYAFAKGHVDDTAKSSCAFSNVDEGLYETIRTPGDDSPYIDEQLPRFAIPSKPHKAATIYESTELLTSSDKLRNKNNRVSVSPYDVSENLGGEYDHITLKGSTQNKGNSLMDRVQKFNYTRLSKVISKQNPC